MELMSTTWKSIIHAIFFLYCLISIIFNFFIYKIDNELNNNGQKKVNNKEKSEHFECANTY